MNNLNGGVTITGFNLPDNDPDGGIHLTLEAIATNVCHYFWFHSRVY